MHAKSKSTGRIAISDQAKIIALAHDMGSDARDFRDAVHELQHALDYECEDMDRDEIHALIMDDEPGGRIEAELRARAVEWLACEFAGIDYDVDKWAFIAFKEAYRSNVRLPVPVAKNIERVKEEDGERMLSRILLAAGVEVQQ